MELGGGGIGVVEGFWIIGGSWGAPCVVSEPYGRERGPFTCCRCVSKLTARFHSNCRVDSASCACTTNGSPAFTPAPHLHPNPEPELLSTEEVSSSPLPGKVSTLLQIPAFS